MSQSFFIICSCQLCWPRCFLARLHIHDTTVVRHAAHLWLVDEHRWQRLGKALPHNPRLARL
jgi:hypothetical protein